MIKRLSITFFLILFLSTNYFIANAQSSQENPTYVVQSGDTLSSIAMRFGVSAADFISANSISNPNAIDAGTELIIPGLQGINGKLGTQTVAIGETLDSLSLRYQVDKEVLNKLNRVTSPLEIFAGTNLILPQKDQNNQLLADAVINSQESLLEVAVRQNKNPWSYVSYNHLLSNWEPLPGNVLYFDNKAGLPEVNGISPYIKSITVKPLPLIQGKTAVIKVLTNQPLELKGQLSNYDLHFFKNSENEYVAMQGISAIEDIGLTELILKGGSNKKEIFNLDQGVLVSPGNYGEDPPLEVDPTTIDPSTTKPEDELINSITSKLTENRIWADVFQFPTDEPCIKSWFGNRRLYNNSFKSYHAGVDLGVCANNLNIYAAAPGIVVYTGQLSIRGNVTIIDHGWGIYTGYFHQKEILVHVGDKVVARQNIGIIGDTGRVTGPHLHWELRVNNIQVNPIDWIENVYP